MSDPRSLRLPDGSLLLHVGPHKTGTTALQAALWAARPELRTQGVRFVPATRNPARAVQAVTGRGTAYDTGSPPPMAEWRSLVRRARPSDVERLVLSSEFFAHATPEVVAKVVSDLGAERLHVVVTVRALARIIPSMWQQNVRSGLKTPIDEWTRGLFERATKPGPARFWTLHRHDELVRRWMDGVGPARVTVIVLDEQDHRAVDTAFEALLGLAPGTLVPPRERQNRSLTVEEAEAIRAFTVAFDADGLDPALRARVMRYGAAEYMARLEPAAADSRITLPRASFADVHQAAEAIVTGLRASGARIIGDLDQLTWMPEDPGSLEGRATGVGPEIESGSGAMTSPEAAARMAMGLAFASGRARRKASTTTAEQASEDRIALAQVPTPQLVASLATRSRSIARSRRDWAGRFVRGHLTPAPVPLPPPTGGRPRIEAVAGPASPAVIASAGEPVQALPAGSILLHIGPPKTGTTALQASFHAARTETERQGVHYAGRVRHSISAIHALLERSSFRSDGVPPARHWTQLRDEIRRSRAPRIVLSSEFLADARPEQVVKVLDELGRDAVHVVVTLRPLAKIIPSQWQQYVQSGLKTGFDPWLQSILAEPPGPQSPSFWHRHRDDRLLARWADVAGTGRVTAIVLDERDHGMVLRAFEALTGLAPGTLRPQQDLANRSLSLPEIELVRHLNMAFKDANLTRSQHSALVNFGATEYLKRLPADPEAPKVVLPGWAFARTSEIGREIVDGIKTSGIRVIGDPDSLLVVPSPASGQPVPEVSRIPGSVAAGLSMGILYATGLARPPEARAGRIHRILPPPMAEPIEITRIPTKAVAAALAQRLVPGRRRS